MAILSSSFPGDARPRARSAPSVTVSGSAFEVIEIKPANAVSFYLRVRASGALFLVAPARCPAQPRLWNLRVHRCLPGSVIDPTEPPWVSPERLRREDLAVAARAIHDDADGWLAREERTALRHWMLRAGARGD
jgi:hypothetical protein